ncbi:MAG: transglutaminase family protein, partial [Pirellulales bacterium]
MPTLAALSGLDDKVLSQADVAAFNLLCATGLPGAENLEIGRLLDWLDDAAERVSLETRRHWYRYRESPGIYKNSRGYYCSYFLLQVLQEDFGVRYNATRAADPSFQDSRRVPDFRDSRDLFIHGIIDGHGGTCGSMPVVYVAVGRRLGYPLKLVETRAHLFIRWDDPLGTRFGVPERFNIEGAGYGMASYPDSHYETWPEPWTSAEFAAGCYLRSLSPREELASFLATRAHCLIDNRRPTEAIQAFRWASTLVPKDERYRNELARLQRWLCPSPQQIYERHMALV